MEQNQKASAPPAPPAQKAAAVQPAVAQKAAKPEAKKVIQVVATQAGYYDNQRISPGQKFTIKKDEEFSDVWMEDLSGRLGKKQDKPESEEE